MGRIYNHADQTTLRNDLRYHATTVEKLLWQYLKNNQLGVKFRRQFGVGRYVLDFYCPELKLAIEIDGPVHDSLEARERDHQRQIEIESVGIRFLRFPADDVFYDLDQVLEVIKKAL